MLAGPRPKPVTANAAVRIHVGALTAAHRSRPAKPRMTRSEPMTEVLRKPHLITRGAEYRPEIAQASMTGVTADAALVASPPRPPWTNRGTYVSRQRKPMP